MSISGISSGGTNRPDFSQIQQSIFDKADSNGDGSIDSSEFNSMIQDSPRLGKALSSLVTNADGSKATPDQIFKAVDTDGDGKISVDELKGAMKTAHAHGRGGHHHGAPPVSDGSSSDDSGTSISSTINQIFKLLDTDGDGQVSSTELGAAMSNLSAASGSAKSTSSDSSEGNGSTDATSAVSSQTAGLQALLQQLLTQIQQQHASYTQNGAATDAGGMPSFFNVSA